jgi:hypothetical protein
MDTSAAYWSPVVGLTEADIDPIIAGLNKVLV